MRGGPQVTIPRPTMRDAPDARLNHPVPSKLTAAQLRALSRHNALDRRFRGMHRLLERWSIGQGSGLPLGSGTFSNPTTRPTPLSPDESVVADLAVLHSPDWVRRFIFVWFRSDKSPEQIGEELDLSRREVYYELKLVLAYCLGRFTELGFKVPEWETDT
jgi:hypothetical protein